MPVNEPSQQFEQEIAELEQELASRREALRQRHEKGEAPESPHEKEALREAVGEKLGKPLPQGDSARPAGRSDPLSYLSEELRGKVQELVNTAFNQSLEEAIKQVRATNNSALIDAFHDVLVDELYDHLMERGKLKNMEP